MLARFARCSVRASPRVVYAAVAPQQLCSVHHISLSQRRPAEPALKQLRSFSFSFPGPRKLADITNLPLLEKEEGAAIAKIWTKFHDTRRDTVGLAIPGSELKALLAKAKRCPMFIFPVHRGDAGGFFSVLCQFQASHFLFTFLDDYRANPATAQPYMTVSTYDDMIDSKNIGLLRADVTAQLSREEGAHLYYSSSGSAADFVETFNHAPAQFDFDAFMASVPLRKVTAAPAPAAAADDDASGSEEASQQQQQQQRKDDA
eukprot:6256-Heterococcus_DN1.PRE.3